MTVAELTLGVLVLLGVVVVLMFAALTATAVFRPEALPDVIELVKTIGLALIGRSRSDELRKRRDDDDDDQQPPTFPAQ